MSAQLTYNYGTQHGVAGGIYDLAPYAIDTFLNAENNGVMKFGIAVVAGTNAGVEVKKPVSASTAIEGVTNNNLSTEMDIDGNIAIKKGAAIGVMRYGRIWVRVATEATPEYGDPAYVVKTGDEAGFFTDSSSSTLAVKGRFLTAPDNGLAVVELFNQAQS
ncbi:MAG: hypothetical protein IJM76_05920 [Lachnospiraceae bacterium]|nr:hypothetical protein [Lachnospiraceae bacterium]